jgi:hypothetical protein
MKFGRTGSLLFRLGFKMWSKRLGRLEVAQYISSIDIGARTRIKRVGDVQEALRAAYVQLTGGKVSVEGLHEVKCKWCV